jgi:LPXTG-site transpeptidase (sortase) family protein
MVKTLRRRWPLALVVAGLLVIVLGVVALRQPAPHHGSLPAPARIIPNDGSITPPPSAPAVVATRVVVRELQIDLPVVPGDGYNTPLYKAAEYPGLAWPGQGSRSMLYAHARTGMFGPLFRAAVGQHVDVTLSDGRLLHYVIREFYPRWQSTDLKWLEPAQGEQLILETCTTYNVNDPRIIAVAEPA